MAYFNNTANNTASTSNTWETNSHRLENFLYAHFISAIRTYKDELGMTVWVYDKTPDLMEIVDEFKKLVAKQKKAS